MILRKHRKVIDEYSLNVTPQNITGEGLQSQYQSSFLQNSKSFLKELKSASKKPMRNNHPDFKAKSVSGNLRNRFASVGNLFPNFWGDHMGEILLIRRFYYNIYIIVY